MARSVTNAELAQRVSKIEDTLDEILNQLRGGASGGSEETVVELSEDEIEALAEALDALENQLTERQRVYMIGMLGAAAYHMEQSAGAEGRLDDVRKLTIRNPDAIAKLRLGDALGSLTKFERGGLGSPSNPLADSVGVGVGVACVGVDWSKDLAAVASGSWRTNPAFGGGPVGGLTQPGGGLGGLPGGFGR
jgi:hypothetical protein